MSDLMVYEVAQMHEVAEEEYSEGRIVMSAYLHTVANKLNTLQEENKNYRIENYNLRKDVALLKRPKGTWLYNSGKPCECSNCHHEGNFTGKDNYCSFCGADMKEAFPF